VKVISGNLKGRNIKGFDIDGTRPTMDRVKESVFGMIQNYVYDSIVLDLFSGSGNYGIEAISNGAKKVYFNDNNKKCIKIIEENLINFNVLNKSFLTNFDYQKALNYYKENNISFDLIFLDPPYKFDVIEDIIVFIEKNNLLNSNGLIICELTDFVLKDKYNSVSLIKERKYGEKKIMIYRKNSIEV